MCTTFIKECPKSIGNWAPSLWVRLDSFGATLYSVRLEAACREGNPSSVYPALVESQGFL